MKSPTATHLSAGGAGAGIALVVIELLDHGPLGILTFGILALASLFFGWLGSRPRPPARARRK